MKEFDKDNAKAFFDDLKKIVDATLGPKYGIVVNLSALKYNNNSAYCKLGAIKSETDDLGYVIKTGEQLEFEKFAVSFGFKPEDYKCKVITGGVHEAILIGFKPKARKNKYIIVIDGQTYVTSNVKKL